jgi:hypothetical protein
VGGGPSASAVGDLNGDGKLDLVVANQFTRTISVFLGNGRGGLSTKREFPTGASPVSVAVADFTGDGRPDVAVANADNFTVTLLVGSGTGSFIAKSDYGVGTLPASIGVGDLNRDGRLDVVAANATSNSLTILFNTGAAPYLGVDPRPSALPATLQFLAPRPNPTRAASSIHFVLPSARAVTIDVLDVTGRRVRSLSAGQAMTAGEHVLSWDGRDESGSRVRAGVYLVKLTAGREQGTRKVVRLE